MSSMMQGPSDRVDGLKPLVLRDHEGRKQADDARSAADREDAFVLERLEDRASFAPQLDPDHEAKPADLADRPGVEASKRLDGLVPEALGALRQLLPHGVLDGGGPSRAGEGVPAERRGMASLEGLLDGLGREGRTDRYAARERFSEGQDVRLHAPPLDRE